MGTWRAMILCRAWLWADGWEAGRGGDGATAQWLEPTTHFPQVPVGDSGVSTYHLIFGKFHILLFLDLVSCWMEHILQYCLKTWCVEGKFFEMFYIWECFYLFLHLMGNFLECIFLLDVIFPEIISPFVRYHEILTILSFLCFLFL